MKYIANLEKGHYPNYIEIIPNAKSLLISPLKSKGEVIGILCLTSKNKNHFNKILRFQIEFLSEYICKLINEKKRNIFLLNQTKPIHYISDDISQLFRNSITSITKYFRCTEYILVKKHDTTFKFITSLSKYYKISENSLFDLLKNKSKNTYNEQFTFYATDNIRIDQNHFCHGLICEIGSSPFVDFFLVLISHSKIKLYDDEKIFLLEVVNRMSVAYNSHKLIRSFIDINNEVDQSLLKFTANALSYLGADIVGIFPFNGTDEILIEDGYISGDLWHSLINLSQVKTNSKAIIASQLAMVNKKDMLFKSKNDYLSFMMEHHLISKDYWDYLEIETVLGLVLKNKGVIIGVLMIEFKSKKAISIKDPFVKIFKELASAALLLNVNLKNKKKALSDLAMSANKYKKLVSITNDLSSKLTLASYQEMVIGLYHDIRNLIMTNTDSVDNLYTDIYEKQSPDVIDYNRESEVKQLKDDIEYRDAKIESLLKLFNFEKLDHDIFMIDIGVETVKKYFARNHHYLDKRTPVDVRIDRDSQFESIKLTGSETLFGMIVFNLVKNSVRSFSRILGTENKWINIKYIRQGKYLELSVEDNGIGMNNDTLQQIYNYGFTTYIDPKTQRYGLGIGLYFVKNVVTEHFAGTIAVESKEGSGTKFIIKIPLK